METRLYKIMRHALCAAVMAMAFAANATTYYWFGSEADDPLTPGNYHVSESKTSAVLTVLPAPGDAVVVSSDNGYAIKFDNDSAAYLASLENVRPRRDASCVIDISTNVTLGTKFNYNYGHGTVVKRGAGTLTLTATGTTDYYTSFNVEGGNLVFPQSGQTSGETYYHAGIAVASDCTVVLDGGQASAAFKLTVQGLSGEGDISYTNTSAICTFTAGGTTEVFSGILSGDKLQLYSRGDLMLANTANTLAYGGNNDMFLLGGTLGFTKFGSKSATATSSFGCLNSAMYFRGNASYDLKFLYLGEGTDTGDRAIRDQNPSRPITFDGGSCGGFTFKGDIYYDGTTGYMKELVLDGSNTTACTYQGSINNYSKTAYYYLTKRGAGTWKMTSITSDKRPNLAGIGVENGTLSFFGVAEQGTTCSIGKAPADYLFGYAYKGQIASAPSTVDYTIRLGNASDLSEEGAFEYTGDADGYCTTRKIAVTGRGRLKSSATKGGAYKAFSWTGVKSVVPPEDASLVPELSTLTLDGISTGKCTLTNITEDAGAAPLRIAKEGAGDWTLGGTLAFTGGIDVREGTLNVGTMTTSLPYLRVDSGATLNMADDAATADALSIDMNEGVGTISGIAFAPSGTLVVTNVVGELEGTTIACDNLGGCVNRSNISGWTVIVNGQRKSLSARMTATGISFAKLGLMMIIK